MLRHYLRNFTCPYSFPICLHYALVAAAALSRKALSTFNTFHDIVNSTLLYLEFDSRIETGVQYYI